MKDEHIIVTLVKENMTEVSLQFLKDKVSFGAQFGKGNTCRKLIYILFQPYYVNYVTIFSQGGL